MGDNKTQPVVYNRHREIRIRGVGDEMQGVVRRAASYYGVDVSDFLRMQLRILVDQLPEHIKNFRPLPH